MFMTSILLFVSGSEILVVLLAVLLLFGSKSIPDVARTIGKAMNEFKKATDDIKKEINESEVGKEIKDLKDDVSKSSGTITSQLNDMGQEIKN
jgi:sec-independent protein translocase protein TatA